MVFLAGWGKGSKLLGLGPELTCENCHNTKQYQIFETSKKVTLYFVPVAKWDKQYWIVCPVCSRGGELNSKEQAMSIIEEAKSQLKPLSIDANGNVSESTSEDEKLPPGAISGFFYIHKIEEEARLQGQELSEFELWFLMESPASLIEKSKVIDDYPHELMDVIAKGLAVNAVNWIRSAIEREKAEGSETILVREGLRLPVDWEFHYEEMYNSNLPWFVSSFAQNAFLGNPFNDETEPWTSL